MEGLDDLLTHARDRGYLEDAKRYRCLKGIIIAGDETYLGEWLTEGYELDMYIDKKIAEEAE